MIKLQLSQSQNVCRQGLLQARVADVESVGLLITEPRSISDINIYNSLKDKLENKINRPGDFLF